MSTRSAAIPHVAAASASRRPLAARNGPNPSASAASAVAKTPEPASSKLTGKTTPGASTKKSPPVWRRIRSQQRGASAAASPPTTSTDGRRSRRPSASAAAAKTPDTTTPNATAPHVGMRHYPSPRVRPLLATAGAVLALGAAALPLKTVGTVRLLGGSSRLDYASIDPGRHRLYMAHLGGGLVIVFDTKKRRVVTSIPAPGAHGVLSVPSIGRVYATATNDRQLLTIDERTNRIVARASAGEYPDGIAYDSADRRVFVSDESGGAEI